MSKLLVVCLKPSSDNPIPYATRDMVPEAALVTFGDRTMYMRIGSSAKVPKQRPCAGDLVKKKGLLRGCKDAI